MAGIDIGIDLGTTTTIIYMNGEIVIEEPSVVAIDNRSGDVLAVGTEAYKMIGRTPEYISAMFPLKEGVISDYDLTEFMIIDFIKRVCGSLVVKPRIAICVPSAITGVERRAVTKAAISAGARKVFLVDEPIAAAIGAGIDISKPEGRLVVDIGGGTSDIAVISLGGVVVSRSVRIAGNHFNDAIIRYVMEKYKVLIGEKTAEQLKIELGDVYNALESNTYEIKGRYLVNGLPRKIVIDQLSLKSAIIELAEKIMSAVAEVLEETPPELAGDVKTNGILMTGGGSMLKGFDKLLESRTNIKTTVADNALEAVAVGTGNAFKYTSNMQDGMTSVTGHDEDF